jgi:tRNA_anti-like
VKKYFALIVGFAVFLVTLAVANLAHDWIAAPEVNEPETKAEHVRWHEPETKSIKPQDSGAVLKEQAMLEGIWRVEEFINNGKKETAETIAAYDHYFVFSGDKLFVRFQKGLSFMGTLEFDHSGPTKKMYVHEGTVTVYAGLYEVSEGRMRYRLFGSREQVQNNFHPDPSRSELTLKRMSVIGVENAPILGIPTPITAPDLISAFARNEVQAKTDYLHKIAVIEGIVTAFGKQGNDFGYVELTGILLDEKAYKLKCWRGL